MNTGEVTVRCGGERELRLLLNTGNYLIISWGSLASETNAISGLETEKNDSVYP